MNSIPSTGLSDYETPQKARRRGTPPTGPPEPLVVGPQECAELLNIGVTKVYEVLPELEFFKDGRSTKITMRSIWARIERQLEAQRDAKPAKELTEAATRAHLARRAERKAAKSAEAERAADRTADSRVCCGAASGSTSRTETAPQN